MTDLAESVQLSEDALVLLRRRLARERVEVYRRDPAPVP